MKKNLAYAAVLMSSVVSLSAFAGGDIAAGKAIADKTCAACHGADFKSPVDPSYPKLAGQHEDYLAHAMIAYQRGADGANGRSNAIMGGQVQALSRKDIQNIAAYLHSLPGPLVLQR